MHLFWLLFAFFEIAMIQSKIHTASSQCTQMLMKEEYVICVETGYIQFKLAADVMTTALCLCFIGTACAKFQSKRR